jgi:hypothetical protein
VAVVPPQPPAECDRPLAGGVMLDGAASSDDDSTPGTHDDIVRFDWYSDMGTPVERHLGNGERLPAILPLGQTRVTLRVIDAMGEAGIAEQVVTIEDRRAPTAGIMADPAALWPPNHRLVPVSLGWQVDDACDPAPSISLERVTSSEPDDAPGDGDGGTSGDIEGASPGTADSGMLLRAERAGGGPGRAYEIVYLISDASGNSARAGTILPVPHDQGGGSEPLQINTLAGTAPDGTRIYWGPVETAGSYDLIAGELGNLRSRDGIIDLGPVRVLARGTTALSGSDPGPEPPPGQAFFYVVQYRRGPQASGYGTESAPLPRVPSSCEGGCP